MSGSTYPQPMASSSSLPRRHSQPPLPVPGLGLRAALLGYLGEVEASIRGRLSGTPERDSEVRDDSSASEGLSEDTPIDELDSGGAQGESSSFTSGLGLDRGAFVGNGEQQLRYRGPPASSSSPLLAQPPVPTRNASYSSQDALLSHLSWLREDILASLPPAVLSAPSLSGSREWLRALPARLMAVERGLWAEGSTSPAGPGSGSGQEGEWGSVPGLALPAAAVESARLKVLEIVRGVLPTDEWEGWERLGWEETDPMAARPAMFSSKLGLSANGDEDGPTEEEEEEESSKFFFPNRTPAAKQAIASRRRTIRSKSLGAAGQPGSWAALQGGGGLADREGAGGMPKLQRMRTMPMLSRTTMDDEDESDGDEVEGMKVASPELGMGNGPEVLEELGVKGEQVRIDSPRKGKGKVLEALGPSIAEALVASDHGRRLMLYENLPIDWRNNEHIVTGYRFIPLHATTGPIPLLKSAFAWHNETINIHSHFIPSMFIMLVIPFIILNTPLPDAHPLDTAVLVLYLTAAISCLFTSAEWHVLSGCASKKWMEWGACVDYVGISWLIAASFGTVVYNAFYCQPKAVLLYCSTNAACGALGSYLPFQRWFNQRRMKPYRIAFFLFLNFAMFAPISQLFWKYGWTKGIAFTSPFVSSIACYAFGLIFYAFHFPECVWPGKFDRVGHSHQIWHLGIVIAIVLHYRAIFTVYGMRHDYSCAVLGAGPPVSAVVGSWWRSLRG